MTSESDSVVPAPGFYVWEAPGNQVSIQISLDVVDRLQQDVIRGFGAVPKRGAEVGGILLGSASAGSVRIDDYQLIPIEYKRGPSYLLSPEDAQAFDSAFEQLRREASESLRPIGYFRSHTRDGIGLGPEDLDLVSKYLPEPETVVLVIRPFGTKPSLAGFYFKEDGAFQQGPPLAEFPFRRNDLAPDEPAPAPSAEYTERAARRRRPPPASEPAFEEPKRAHRSLSYRNLGVDQMREKPLDVMDIHPTPAELRNPPRRGLFGVPLALIFFVLGILLGVILGLSFRPTQNTGDPYNLSLTVTKSGNDLQLRWDKQAEPVKNAKRGVLTIDDGTFTKPVNLDLGQLQNGGMVVYRHFSAHVRFRLELFLTDRDSVMERLEWNQ